MNILRLGHAMYVLKSTAGKNYLIDPFFELNPGFPKELNHADFYQSINCVFLTHGHIDHTSGLSRLVKHKPDIMIVAQYELALILLHQGIKNVFPINTGGSVSFDDVTVTMVQAKHTSSYRETEGGAPIYAGESAGYIFEDVYQPKIAILSSSGHFTMGPKEAAYAVKHLLNVEYVIPSHTFPSKETASSPESLTQLLQAFPVVEYMIDKDNELKELLKDYKKTEVIPLGYGEEKEFSKPR